MIHDLIRYSTYGVSIPDTSQSDDSTTEENRKDEEKTKKGNKNEQLLSPFITMAQLCYDAWLLERIGNNRAKWVYSLLRQYRERLCSGTMEKEKVKYELSGVIAEWPFPYFNRSPQVYL